MLHNGLPGNNIPFIYLIQVALCRERQALVAEAEAMGLEPPVFSPDGRLKRSAAALLTPPAAAAGAAAQAAGPRPRGPRMDGPQRMVVSSSLFPVPRGRVRERDPSLPPAPTRVVSLHYEGTNMNIDILFVHLHRSIYVSSIKL